MNLFVENEKCYHIVFFVCAYFAKFNGRLKETCQTYQGGFVYFTVESVCVKWLRYFTK